MSLDAILKKNRVVPVVILEDDMDAVPLAEALLAGGIHTMEITLRTEAGLPSIEAVAREVPQMIVGAGTVTNAGQFAEAVEAGSQFVVSPGLTHNLAEAARQFGVSYLPGVVTPGEVITAMDEGFFLLKLFPAKTFGGASLLKQYASVFPQVRFCPTGGIALETMHEYLSLSNVLAVGGSWLTPAELIRKKDWKAITALAKEVSGQSLLPA